MSEGNAERHTIRMNWRKFATLALNHMRAYAHPPYAVTVKEFKLTLIGRPFPQPMHANQNDAD